jgi:hypothetical protein
MLLGLAVFAVTISILREWFLLNSSRDRFQAVEAGWNAGIVTFEEYVAASEKLMAVESDVLWISQNAARSRHVQNLKQLLLYMESGICEWHPDIIDSRSDLVRREIHRYDP